jgi:plastocyanin
MKRTLAIAAVAAAIPLAAGCGGSSDDPAPEPAAAASSGAAVQMVDNAFEAKDITVSAGDTVTWTNSGSLPHNATSSEFESATIAPGETFRWTAEKPGTVDYVCTFHPGMEGTITVQ